MNAPKTEWQLLDLLPEHSPLRISKLVEAIGSVVAVAEAIEALQAAGLIERTDTLVQLAVR